MKRLLQLLLMAILIFSVFNFNQASRVTAQTNTVIDPLLEKVLETEQGPYEVIVTFKGEREPTTDQVNILEKLGIDIGVTMQSLPIAGVLATKSQIEELSESDQVKSIYFNRKLEYYNADATELTGVDRVRNDPAMTAANGDIPITGEGIGVVVNDSGIDGTHPDHPFGENLVQNVMSTTTLSSLAPGLVPINYLENVPNTDATSGHGTHVAGTVGTGAASDGLYEGVAPGAELVGYGSGAALFILDAIGGFDYAITHQEEYDIRVITNSWGSSGAFDPNAPVNVASKKAYDHGMVVLFAAGNSGPGENTHNPYAKAPWVISVAAGNKDGATLADFSSRGTKGFGGTFEMDGKTWEWKDQPTITAPGVDIISTRALAPVSSLAINVDLQGIEPEYVPYYTTMSGTSMATPHVAGIVALMLEANPQLTPAQVKQIIVDTATAMPGYEAWEVGAGYVNAYDAVDAALNGAGS